MVERVECQVDEGTHPGRRRGNGSTSCCACAGLRASGSSTQLIPVAVSRCGGPRALRTKAHPRPRSRDRAAACRGVTMPISSVSKMAQNNLLNSKTPASEIMVRAPPVFALPFGQDSQNRLSSSPDAWLRCRPLVTCLTPPRVCNAVGPRPARWADLHPEGGGRAHPKVEAQRHKAGGAEPHRRRHS
jgi:hypothetical protein